MTVNTNEEINKLFKLYLEGNTTPEQEEELFFHIGRQEEMDKSFEESTAEIWNEDNSWRDDSLSAKAELQSVWSKIAEEEDLRKKANSSWLKYAASFILVCAAALGWYAVKTETKEGHQPIALMTKITKRGERVKLLLPDSSVVYLNAVSKLSFPQHFEKGKTREIHLEGEAFFEVKSDASRPFIVHSGNLQTRVLGTSFNIDAYPGSQHFSVSVRTGKVGVSASNEGKLTHLSFLTPGKNLVYKLRDSSYAVNETRADDFNSWTENRFIFKNELLSIILTRLERSYNVSFKVKNNKMLKSRFNATFQNKNIKQIIEELHIMSSGKIHYEFNAPKTIITLWGEEAND
ncbi:FecR family protein [Pedobacter caeni]|uniref:FecR family protein n=1 Tax=Pedobacter caeni TaxID=288992 RepID=A0A1M5G6U8_9SPHI|nr:FecR family protein [Pedobacter caeni]